MVGPIAAPVLGILYGLHLVLLIYALTYFMVRGAMKGRVYPAFLILPKYFIYWLILDFGFKHLSVEPVMIGFTAGIFLSLPALYFLNRR